MHYYNTRGHSKYQPQHISLVCVLTEYSLAILCRSLSCSITEYSECLVGYSFIIRSITSSLRRAVRPANADRTHSDCINVLSWENVRILFAVVKQCYWFASVWGLVLTQSTLCLSNNILFTQVKLLFVGQVSSLHIYRATHIQHHWTQIHSSLLQNMSKDVSLQQTNNFLSAYAYITLLLR